jgi:beta-glucosidase
MKIMTKHIRWFIVCLVAVTALVSKASVSDKQAMMLANEILGQLTLEEKISLCHGSGTFTVTNIPRVGIEREFTMVDNSSTVVGDVARMKWGTTEEGKKQTATAFPTLSAVGATWDRELVGRLGDALGKEARFRGKDMQLGPGVNIHRTPLCGRNWEYFGEDPAHAAKMVVPYIKGLQQNDVAATVKHFVGNNSEWNRYRVDVDPDERTLREIYFPAFEAAVKQGGVLSVMSGYNRVRGEWCSHSDYLNNQILKKEWGFKGLVVTDWDGLHDTMKGALGGTDLEMNMGANIRYFKEPLLDAVKTGTIPQAVLDDKVRRVLFVMAKTKFIGNHSDREKGAYETPEHTAIARKIAEASVTLLKNEDQVLPLKREEIKTLLVIGDNAIRKQCPGWHSGRANPKHEVTPLEGIKTLVGEDVQLTFRNVKGAGKQIKQLPETWILTQDPNSKRVGFGQPAFRVEYFNNTELKGAPTHTAYDKHIDFNKRRERLPEGVRSNNISIRWSATISPDQSGEYVLGAIVDDGIRVFVNNKLIANNWRAGGKRIAQGDIRLEKGQEYRLRVEYLEFAGDALCEFGLLEEGMHDFTALAAEAAQSDAVIYFTGNNHDMSQPVCESETVDRKSMALYPHDDRAIAAVLKAKRDAVIVNLSGVAVAMPWVDDAKALVQYYFSGQEGGHAIADVLFGNVNPSGKLTFTMPKKLSDSPAHALDDYNGTHMTYQEGVFVGYRWFDAKNIVPLFPFGHGLSYTTFEIGQPKLSSAEMKAYGGVFVRVPVTNIGKVGGAEVVQLYVAPPKSAVERPVRELKTFGKVFLKSGEAKEVEMWLSWRDLAYWDIERNSWHVVPGKYRIEIGASSRDIRTSTDVHYSGLGAKNDCTTEL